MMTAARLKATLHWKNAIEFRDLERRSVAQIRRVDRALRSRRLVDAVSELLFVEMTRADVTRLSLSRKTAIMRLRWLNGPVRRVYARVFAAVNRVSPVKLSPKNLRSLS
jgi:hypothetical protein